MTRNIIGRVVRRFLAIGPINYGNVYHVTPVDAEKARHVEMTARKTLVDGVLKKFIASRKFPIKAIEEFQDPISNSFRGYVNHLHEAYYALNFSPEDPQSKTLFDRILDVESQLGRFGRDSLYELKQALNSYPDDTNIVTAFKTERSKWLAKALALLDHAKEVLEVYSEYGQKLPKKQIDPNPESVEEFSIGRLRVAVVDSSVTPSKVREFAGYLKQAHHDLESHGLGKVWYGLILFSPNYKIMSDFEKKQYAAAGYDIAASVGVYHSGEDIIAITSPPGDWVIDTIIHELGHRYWFRFLSSGQRARYENFLEGDFSKIHALLLNATLLSEEDAKWLSGKYQDYEHGKGVLNPQEKKRVDSLFEGLGIRAGLPPVSTYGKTNIIESFAEHFRQYVTGNSDRENSEFFRTMLASSSIVDRVVFRFFPV